MEEERRNLPFADISAVKLDEPAWSWANSAGTDRFLKDK